MVGIKDLTKELLELKQEMKQISTQIANLSDKAIVMSEQISKSMDNISITLQETNETIRESLKITSNTIQKMSETFSNAMENALKNMGEMKIQMDVRDTILKSLGIDGIISDFFKKRK